MKQPILRITKWLRDIPLAANCTYCPEVSFKAQLLSDRPKRQDCQKSLQTQFDVHCNRVHTETLICRLHSSE